MIEMLFLAWEEISTWSPSTHGHLGPLSLYPVSTKDLSLKAEWPIYETDHLNLKLQICESLLLLPATNLHAILVKH